MVVVKLYLILNSGQFWIDFWWGKVCWLIVDFGVFLPHNKIELWLESGYGCTSPILGKIGENLTDTQTLVELPGQNLRRVLVLLSWGGRTTAQEKR